jgi:hypothetical protein
MNIIKLSHREDFGHDWYVQVLFTKRFALFQASVSWNDYPSWPYIQIKSGTGSVLSIIFWAYRFGLDIGILERTWDWGKGSYPPEKIILPKENFDRLVERLNEPPDPAIVERLKEIMSRKAPWDDE